MKLLMVCLGNICRSPLAEGIMQQQLAEAGLDWIVDSAGTVAYHVGERPDSRSVEVAHKHGIYINDQRARQFRAADLDEFDFILVMDDSNYRNVMALATSPEQEEKVKLILNYGTSRRKEVPDPYYDGGFDVVYNLLDDSCAGLLAALQKEER